MKIRTSISVLFLIGGLFFTSCNKESEGGGTTTKTDKIEVTIDGQKWMSSGNNLSWASSGGIAQLNGMGSGNSMMQIFVDEGVTGTFDVTDNVTTISYNDGSTTYSNNVSGSVTITANASGHMEGSFSIKNASYFSNDTLDMTNGTFYYKF